MTDNTGKITVSDDNLYFIFEQEAGGYYIKDGKGRYFYQDGVHANFNVVKSKDKATVWTITPNANGTFLIKSPDGHVVQYSKKYKSYGAYKPANTNDVYPMLYMEDPTLGIMTIETVKDDGGAVYNLQGVRMPDGVKLQPGIYVRSGKKFFVR